jgi:hypothetical protein
MTKSKYDSMTKAQLLTVIKRRDRTIAHLERDHRNLAGHLQRGLEYDPSVDLHGAVADHSEPEPAVRTPMPNPFEGI